MKHPKKKLNELIAQLEALHEEALALEKKFAPALQKVHPSLKKSTKNLLHYLALRQHDIRDLQNGLAQIGLSSLGRAEGHVLASLQAVREQLCLSAACEHKPEKLTVSLPQSRKLLTEHTQALLGPPPLPRSTRIMVTFSTDLASDYDLVMQMLKAGMNCARINCAHDTKKEWKKMVRNIRKAEQETGLLCKILFDLMGPKLRTGPLKSGPKAIAIRPVQNELGQTAAPAQVWLGPAKKPGYKQADAFLPVDAGWVAHLQEGDKIYFTDTRGRKRQLLVVARKKNGALAHLLKTSYIATDTRLVLKDRAVAVPATKVGELPAMELTIILKKDHPLVLHRELIPGEPAQLDKEGRIITPAHIGCTLPEVFLQTKEGQRILFDDGAITGEIQEVHADRLLVRITFAKATGSKLRADKGINLPETDLRLNELTLKDRQDLRFAAKHADAVNLSFANDAAMVGALLADVKQLQAEHLAVMLKIETKESFQNLPYVLLKVMQHYPVGIMIARGDLAVECGWERLAEVQEEILWLCEAAHIPVVWATQVLESLAKKGTPSRAEITDAAMSQRADCVMLNKGPHIIEAIGMLDNILVRMQEHQHKKTPMLRSLRVSDL
jgi:pyruvate kinase